MHVKSVKYLGDIIQESGSKILLIEDRIKKGNAVIVNCFALCNQLMMGIQLINVALVLYKSVLIPTLFYNSQSWRNITISNYKSFQTTQLKFLKRIMMAARSTPNSFVFLEFGELPAEHIIHARQLSFLHHIHTLDDNDPVKKMYLEQQKLIFEKNWANDMKEVITKYNLHREVERIVSFSKEKWKKLIKNAIEKVAFSQLTVESRSMTKTSTLIYEYFNPQPYLFYYPYKTACTIFKLRSKSFNCKVNQASAHNNLICRACKEEEESQDHIINCPVIRKNGINLNSNDINDINILKNKEHISKICQRYEEFEQFISDNGEIHEENELNIE